MSPLQILAFSATFAVVSFGLIAKWFYMPKLQAMSRHDALIRLAAIHTTRCAGLAFIIPGVTGKALDPRFADWAAYGDLASAVLALLSILALRYRWPMAIGIVWLFNIVGLADIVNALIRVFIYIPDVHFGGAWYIPIFAVPILIITHIIMFYFLMRKPEPDQA